MNYLIDLTGAADRREIHDILARTLGLPAHYGRNLDALWDCLTGDLQTPCEIHLLLGKDTPYLQALRNVFEQAQAWHARRGHEMRLLIEHK